MFLQLLKMVGIAIYWVIAGLFFALLGKDKALENENLKREYYRVLLFSIFWSLCIFLLAFGGGVLVRFLEKSSTFEGARLSLFAKNFLFCLIGLSFLIWGGEFGGWLFLCSPLFYLLNATKIRIRQNIWDLGQILTILANRPKGVRLWRLLVYIFFIILTLKILIIFPSKLP
jgi:hypothetical protein